MEARAQTGLPVNDVTHLATSRMVASSEVLPSRPCRLAHGTKAFISLNTSHAVKDFP